MLGKKILQGLVFVVVFTSWHFYFQEAFFGWVAGVSKDGYVGVFEVAAGYGIAFTTAYLISFMLVRQLKLDEGESRTSWSKEKI